LPNTLCAVYCAACELASKEMAIDDAWIQFLSNQLCRGIEDRIPMVTLNGHPERRYHGCVNYSFSYVEGESL
jgi:cysteine desulfurase